MSKVRKAQLCVSKGIYFFGRLTRDAVFGSQSENYVGIFPTCEIKCVVERLPEQLF